MSVRTFFLRFFIALPVACSHHDQRVELEQTLQTLRCEKSFEDSFDSLQALQKTSKQIRNHLWAYTSIAGHYTTEILWDATAGVVTLVALCGPTLVLAARTPEGWKQAVSARPTYFGDPPLDAGVCLPLKGLKKGSSPLGAPPLGRQSVHATKHLRCPDTQPVLRAIEDLVRCYRQRQDKESLQKALVTLENLEMSTSFYECLKPEEQLSLQSLRTEVQKRSAETL